MKKSIPQFKIPSVNNLSNHLRNHVSELVNEGRQVKDAVSELQASLANLQAQMPLVNKVTSDLQTDLDRWQAQCQPVIQRLQDLVEQINHQ